MTQRHAGFQVVIPARYDSSRLPGKPLADILGKPMVQWVVEAAQRSGALGTSVATDDARIQDAVQSLGGDSVLTRTDHSSGTDRLAEVAAIKGWSDDTIVVNVQGDEPGMPPALIDQVANLLVEHPDAGVASLYTALTDDASFRDPNVVKVVTGLDGKALYFSRAPIPHDRDGDAGDRALGKRHIGLYAYRVASLRAFTQWSPSPLERREKLEQLRFMEQGVSIAMAQACTPPPMGVDTKHDLTLVRTLLKETL